LIRKIKSSLSVKIFISTTAILLIVSFFIFGTLRIVMPTVYHRHLDAQLANNIVELVSELETSPPDQWTILINVFVSENNAAVELSKFEEDWSLTHISTAFPSEHAEEFLRISYHLGETTGINLGFTYNDQLYRVATTSIAIINAVNHMEEIFAQVFPYVFIGILLIATLAAFFYTRFLAKPIVEIAHVSKKMADLDMSWYCKTNRSDEIGLLANRLNYMASQLASTLQELQEANEKLQADIEKEREHERRRRDFFTAVSHELKTPVTILKGELDGMILNVGKFKDRDKYLQEAYKTNESIEKLVREMMTLAKLDTISLKLEKIDLPHMINKVSKTYKPIAQQKQINIKVDTNPAIYIEADQIQLQTVISNVISNAIKHSPAGQNVEVSLTKENEFVVFTVENKSFQIEESEILKLWEPFYRTDKSRSRHTGGSGLGLYIVKTILDLHGFSYKLENNEFGVKFTIDFKM